MVRFWMRPAKLSGLAVLLFLSVVPARSQEADTPAPGSPERKAIMDAIRVPCERELGQKVIFEASLVKISGNWAAARVQPLQPGSKPIDFRRTRYKEQVELGMFDPTGEALLKRKDDKWTVLKWRFGATDSELSSWIEVAGAPASLVQ
jgi:hypothetical protein